MYVQYIHASYVKFHAHIKFYMNDKRAQHVFKYAQVHTVHVLNIKNRKQSINTVLDPRSTVSLCTKVGSVIDRDFWVLKIGKIMKYTRLYVCTIINIVYHV